MLGDSKASSQEQEWQRGKKKKTNRRMQEEHEKKQEEKKVTTMKMRMIMAMKASRKEGQKEEKALRQTKRIEDKGQKGKQRDERFFHPSSQKES